MTMRKARRVIEAASALSLISLLATPAYAAEALDGSQLGVIWALPFIGMLLSIALGPLVRRRQSPRAAIQPLGLAELPG